MLFYSLIRFSSREATAQQNGSLTQSSDTSPDSLSSKWGQGLKLWKLKHTQGACTAEEARPEPGSGAFQSAATQLTVLETQTYHESNYVPLKCNNLLQK